MDMNRIKTFSKEQVENLLKNKNVLRFKGKYVSYVGSFKVKAVKLYLNKRMSTNEIFTTAGFDTSIVDRKRRKYLMNHWVKIYRKRGFRGLETETRGRNGRRLNTKIDENLPDKEKIRQLLLQVEYLKKENSFLAKLRARKTE